ncbi:hypothetical protein BDV33DRAFT_185146 [Aspergillus novoparasiticus]|uniref:Uncharacterized protein n=1 Tax=Aspergillus novoparasiticus TaxID=986946 RepID=A0A5N6EA06_9EURO|nr:hypothetical protein BDV33DRAFT_185146 [Aspergillus novoparasiticus]
MQSFCFDGWAAVSPENRDSPATPSCTAPCLVTLWTLWLSEATETMPFLRYLSSAWLWQI